MLSEMMEKKKIFEPSRLAAVHDKETNGGSSNSHDNFSSRIHNLDDAIARLGDASFTDKKLYDCGESLVKTFAPSGLEKAFQQLYSILYPCLCTGDSTVASAILMGPRGSGKSLLLERCLAACKHQKLDAKFRKVSINGIVIRGEDLPVVVSEIIRQLSDIAIRETMITIDDSEGVTAKRRKTEEYLLRLRKSPFTSNLSLLEDTLKVAEADGIPILLVLDELDCFTDEGDRQLLLYHLLDRVATPGSNLCFVGLTSNFTTLNFLEKRIRSRAEGTSKVVYVQPPKSFDDLLKVLERKLDNCFIKNDFKGLLTPPVGNGGDQMSRVRSFMEREFRLGKDVRWFSRVLYCAISLYRHDCLTNKSTLPLFEDNHIVEALASMGANVSDDSTETGTQLAMFQNVAVDPRVQALLDLSPPQVALLLCARRILARDSHCDALAPPLTVQRIHKEYESHPGIKLPILPLVWQLFERGLLVPASDHSGGGPLQYNISRIYKNMDQGTMFRLPLHLPVEVDRELCEALNKNLLDCSTAVREWGRKIN